MASLLDSLPPSPLQHSEDVLALRKQFEWLKEAFAEQPPRLPAAKLVELLCTMGAVVERIDMEWNRFKLATEARYGY